jgi:hypothetical protein
VTSAALAIAAGCVRDAPGGLAGSAPGRVRGCSGQHWREAATVLVGACLGLTIGGPVSTATVGHLFAVGDVWAMLRASIFQTVAMFAVTTAPLPSIGVAAVGWVASPALSLMPRCSGGRP